MSTEQWLHQLYDRLGVLCKSAHYVVLQAPRASTKVRHCLHEAGKVVQDIQRNDLIQEKELEALNQMLQQLFNQPQYALPEIVRLRAQAQALMQNYRQRYPLKKRGVHPAPPLNVKRTET